MYRPLFCRSSKIMFQSTHPRGVRLVDGFHRYLIFKVSIHAPARGATQPQPAKPKEELGFNPRTREGCDGGQVIHLEKLTLFQSTHPRGVRHTNLVTTIENQLFQSTHPRGVRHHQTKWRSQLLQFQSTHPRGVRLKESGTTCWTGSVSIHAPARGATWTAWL